MGPLGPASRAPPPPLRGLSPLTKRAALLLKRRRICRARVDVMDGYDLKSARRVLEVAHHRCPLRDIGRALRSQSGRMTKRVASVLQCDETETLGGIEPFNVP